MNRKTHRDVYIGAGLLLVSAAFLLYGWTSIAARDAKILPCFLLAVMCVLSASIIVKGVRATKESDYHYAYTIKDSKEPLLAYAICLAYLALFWWLGYFASTPIFLIALMRYLKAGSWKKIIIITIIYTVIISLCSSRCSACRYTASGCSATCLGSNKLAGEEFLGLCFRQSSTASPSSAT